MDKSPADSSINPATVRSVIHRRLPTGATLIGLSGKQFSGKDTLADILLEKLPGFHKLPLAQAIKQAYAEQHGLTLEEIERDKAVHRPGLIALGNAGRAQDHDYWLKQVLTAPGRKIVSDVRLKYEFDAIRAAGGYLIRLEASREVRATRGHIVSETDATESELDSIPVSDWDAVLVNNGSLSDLQAQAEQLL